MHRRIVATLAVLALTVGGISGCKKKSPEGTEAPAGPSATAPATTTAPPASQSTTGTPPTAAASNGETLYKQHCAACHPDGGNPMNAKKTLHKADMDANNVKTAEDVVKLMRNPGHGMTKFDTTTIPDSDAKAIADYVMATYYK